MSGGSTWTQQSDDELVRLFAAGMIWDDIARMLGRATAACQFRLYSLRRSGKVDIPKRCAGLRKTPIEGARACLRCGSDFPSEGAHNRVCGSCKAQQSWHSGADDVSVQVPR